MSGYAASARGSGAANTAPARRRPASPGRRRSGTVFAAPLGARFRAPGPVVVGGGGSFLPAAAAAAGPSARRNLAGRPARPGPG